MNNSIRLIFGLLAIVSFQNCSSGYKGASGHQALNTQTSSSSYGPAAVVAQQAGYQNFTAAAPPLQAANAALIERHLQQVQSATLVACTEIKVAAGQSLAKALNLAIAAGKTGAFCANPGDLDVEVRLPENVVLVFRSGTYRQSAPIVLESNSGVIGTSAASTILKYIA